MEIKLRKDKMTREERWQALLNRQPMDRIPVYALYMGFATVNAGLPLVDWYNNPQTSYEGQLRTTEKFGVQDLPWMGYGSYGGWEFGGEIKWPSGFAQAPTVHKHPVETEEDVWNLKLPDVKTAGNIPNLIELARLVEKSGDFYYILCDVKGPFTTAGNIVGVEKMCKWTLKKPEVAEHVMRLATDHVIELTEYFADTFPVERMIFFEAEPTSTNQLISPKQFERFAFPYIRELHERMLATGVKHILCHICGDQNLNLPYWTQVPMGAPGIISIGQEIDIEIAARHFPNDIILGNADPSFFLNGTPEQVYEAAKVCIEKGKYLPGGFILSPGCEIPPQAPDENVWAMMQAVSDFGWYE